VKINIFDCRSFPEALSGFGAGRLLNYFDDNNAEMRKINEACRSYKDYRWE